MRVTKKFLLENGFTKKSTKYQNVSLVSKNFNGYPFIVLIGSKGLTTGMLNQILSTEKIQLCITKNNEVTFENLIEEISLFSFYNGRDSVTLRYEL